VRYYSAPSSLNIDDFAQAHFTKEEIEASRSSFDGGYHTSERFSALALCPNRNAAYCAVTYSAEALSARRQEIRVDVAVAWIPATTVLLPTSGVVTVTGYGAISPSGPSSQPVSVTLTVTQKKKLRTDIARLRHSSRGFCMEDSALYKISVTTTARSVPFWSATADLCPGSLTVSTQGHVVTLNARSCPLANLVGSFFAAHTASGTKADLSTCRDTE